jgi:hypothetical protein
MSGFLIRNRNVYEILENGAHKDDDDDGDMKFM